MAGRTHDEIAAQTGPSRTGVFYICKRHEADCVKVLQDAPGGRRLGEGRRLDAAQEAAVRKLITDKTPDQLKMPYALWARAEVGAAPLAKALLGKSEGDEVSIQVAPIRQQFEVLRVL